jgi:hypothetical protein
MLSIISEGHADLADFMFLLAAVAFVVAFLCILIPVVDGRIERLAETAGLALVAFGLFVT